MESVHTPRGTRQRTLLNLGANFDLAREHWNELCIYIEASLAGQELITGLNPELEEQAKRIAEQVLQKKAPESEAPNTLVPKSTPEYISLDVNSLAISNGRSLGGESICLEMIHELGLDSFFQKHGFSQKEQALALGTLIGRLLHPGSERATLNWLQRSSGLGELIDFDFNQSSLNRFYEISDKLLQKKKAIEEFLYQQESNLFSFDETFVLYDLTNTFFEGSGKYNEKAKRGRSKEKRSDCPLITLGLVLDRHGFPRRSDFFDGNVSEPKTLAQILDSLSSGQLGLEKPTVVLDAGIATEKNLDWLKENEYLYIVVSRKKGLFPEEGDFERVNSNPKNLVEAKLLRNEENQEWELYCHSEGKEKKEESIKTSFQKRFEEDLQSLNEGLKKKGCTKKYTRILERIGRLKEKYKRVSSLYLIEIKTDTENSNAIEIQWNRIKDKNEKCLNGVYCLRSNVPTPSAKWLWQNYIMLTEVEFAFRCMKSELGMRPVFHQKTKRVEGHLWITLLAYHVMHSIRYRLKEKGVHFSWDTIREIMAPQVRVSITAEQENGKQFHLRKTGEPNVWAKNIYHALGYPQQPGKTVKVSI